MAFATVIASIFSAVAAGDTSKSLRKKQQGLFIAVLMLLALAPKGVATTPLFLYQEDWGTTNGGTNVTALSGVGWKQVLGSGFSSLIFSYSGYVDDATGAGLPTNSMSLGSSSSGLAIYYTTNGAGSGTYGDSAFTSIDPTLYTNLDLSVYAQSNYDGSALQGWFAVQVGGAWYVSTNHPIIPNWAEGIAFHRTDMIYQPAATNWNNLTVNSSVAIGGQAGAALSGLITGIGLVAEATTGGYWDVNEFQITPLLAAPVILSVATNYGQVSLTWSAVATATNYKVKRATTSGAETTIATTAATNYTDTSVVAGKMYYYEVSALNSGGESSNSAEVTATPPIPLFLYQEDWGATNGGTNVTALSGVGWKQVLGSGFSSLIFSSSGYVDDATGAGLPTNSMSLGSSSSGLAIYYTTNGAGSGTYGDSAFTSIDPTLYTNLDLSVYAQSNYDGSALQGWFAVQVGGAWYVSTNHPIIPNWAEGIAFHRTDMIYNPAATNWNNLTVNSSVAIGGQAGAALSGLITGIGLVADATTGGYWDVNEVQITPWPTTTKLTRTAGGSPSTYGGALTFQAVVSPDPGNGSTVTFYTNGVAFGTAITTGGTATLTPAANALKYSLGSAYTVTAAFGGNANYVSSSGTLSGGQQINQATVTITSGLTANNLTYNGTTAATISSNNVVLSGVLAGDTSNVALSTNGYTAAFATASVGTSKTITVSGLTLTGSAAGNYTLTQPSLSANITAASTLLAVASSLNPALPGSNVTFTATVTAVSPGAGTPTGLVNFRIDGTILGAGTLSGGVAMFLTNNLPHGSNTVVAEYAGDLNFIGSTNSLTPNQVINTPPVAGNVTLNRNPVLSLKFLLATLLTNASDADGDMLNLTVSALSASNATVTVRGAWVFYTPPPGFTNADSFPYTVTDGYGGSATGTVSVAPLVNNDQSQNLTITVLGGGSNLINGSGIPGYTYRLQYSYTADPFVWQDIASVAAASTGQFNFIDTPPTNSPPRFYSSAYP